MTRFVSGFRKCFLPSISLWGIGVIIGADENGQYLNLTKCLNDSLPPRLSFLWSSQGPLLRFSVGLTNPNATECCFFYISFIEHAYSKIKHTVM